MLNGYSGIRTRNFGLWLPSLLVGQTMTRQSWTGSLDECPDPQLDLKIKINSHYKVISKTCKFHWKIGWEASHVCTNLAMFIRAAPQQKNEWLQNSLQHSAEFWQNSTAILQQFYFLLGSAWLAQRVADTQKFCNVPSWTPFPSKRLPEGRTLHRWPGSPNLLRPRKRRPEGCKLDGNGWDVDRNSDVCAKWRWVDA